MQHRLQDGRLSILAGEAAGAEIAGEAAGAEIAAVGP
jgi:hypothetical protein